MILHIKRQTTKLKTPTTAQSMGFVVSIAKGHESDVGIMAHELEHVKQLCMRLVTALSLALLTTSCAVLQDRKAAVAYAYAGTAADFASTKIKLDEGCRETNPLLGQPSDATLAAVALGSLALVYAMDKTESPIWAFWLLGTLHGGAAAYNMTVNCK